MKEDRNSVPPFYAALEKEVAELVGPVIQLLIGEGLIFKIEGLFLGAKTLHFLIQSPTFIILSSDRDW